MMSNSTKEDIKKEIKITVIERNKPTPEAIRNTAIYLKSLCK